MEREPCQFCRSNQRARRTKLSMGRGQRLAALSPIVLPEVHTKTDAPRADFLGAGEPLRGKVEGVAVSTFRRPSADS